MSLHLDRHASSVSPPDPVPAPAQGPGKAALARQQRHALRRAVGRALPHERVAACGQKAIGQSVTLHHHAGRAHFGAVETCGSVWNCPVCAARITEGRREDIDAALIAYQEADGCAYMATLTVPHHRFQACRDLRRSVTDAWRSVKGGKPWIKARRRYGWIGDVRALEVTHGANGWHPHLHVLILFQRGATDANCRAFSKWLFERWRTAIERQGLGLCSRDAFTFEPVTDATGAAEYVSKWGAALELTKAHVKHAGTGGRTPWQILADYAASGSRADLRLFREYAAAFKGARQLTWSRGWTETDCNGEATHEPGIRERYLSDPEPSDDDLAETPAAPETHVASLDRDVFQAVVRLGKTAELLNAFEVAGSRGTLKFLRALGIRCRVSPSPSLELKRWVPRISREPPGDVPEPCQSMAWLFFPPSTEGVNHATRND